MEQPTNKLTLWLAKKIAVVIIKWRGNRLQYVKAIKQAEKNCKGIGGKRTYIYFIGGRYRALNRKQIQYWRNHTKGVRVGLKVSEMQNIQLYDTYGHINSHPLYTDVAINGIDIKYVRSKDLK
jgi:hypothetical protein